MLRVGILSLNRYSGALNYGAYLQSFALQRVLMDLGCEAEIVRYCPKRFIGHNTKYPWRSFKSREFKMRFFMASLDCRAKWAKFSSFGKKHMRWSANKYLAADFEQLSYDAYIVGSDIVWSVNYLNGFDPVFLGDVQGMKNLIAYAPSFGDSKLSQEECIYFRKCIQRFSAVSVREMSNEEAFGMRLPQVRTVLDPTMLLPVKHYENLAVQPSKRKPYILVYLVAYKDEGMLARVDAYAKERGIDIVEVSVYYEHGHPKAFNLLTRVMNKVGVLHNVSGWMPSQDAIPHEMRFDVGIEDWLGLIDHADMVVTNSFHGAVFSILFRRKFWIINRPDANLKLDTLLSTFALGVRRMTKDSNIDAEIDYDSVFTFLDEKRKFCVEWLKNVVSKIK